MTIYSHNSHFIRNSDMAGKTILIFTCFILLISLETEQALCGEAELTIAQLMDEQLIPDGDKEIDGAEFDFKWVESEEKTQGKSILKAGALSLLLPGAGEYYLGRKSRAAFFFGTEAVIWGGYFAFRAWGNWRKDDYMSFAAEHAGANVNGKDDEFFERMQFYDSRDWYNEIEGERYGGAYPYTDFYYWQWDNTKSHLEYRKIRNSSETAFRNATFVIGIAALHRIVSFVDAVRLGKRMNKTGDLEIYGGWNLDYDAKPFSSNPSAILKLVKTIN